MNAHTPILGNSGWGVRDDQTGVWLADGYETKDAAIAGANEYLEQVRSFPVGTRVRLTHDVDRFPHFIAPAGSTGTVTVSGVETLNVKLDEHLEGAEEWENEVVWSVSDGDDPRKALEPFEGYVATAKEGH